jgi:hypothetical protein
LDGEKKKRSRRGGGGRSKKAQVKPEEKGDVEVPVENKDLFASQSGLVFSAEQLTRVLVAKDDEQGKESLT